MLACFVIYRAIRGTESGLLEGAGNRSGRTDGLTPATPSFGGETCCLLLASESSFGKRSTSAPASARPADRRGSEVTGGDATHGNSASSAIIAERKSVEPKPRKESGAKYEGRSYADGRSWRKLFERPLAQIGGIFMPPLDNMTRR